jgi:hypothetical protein
MVLSCKVYICMHNQALPIPPVVQPIAHQDYEGEGCEHVYDNPGHPSHAQKYSDLKKGPMAIHGCDYLRTTS